MTSSPSQHWGGWLWSGCNQDTGGKQQRRQDELQQSVRHHYSHFRFVLRRLTHLCHGRGQSFSSYHVSFSRVSQVYPSYLTF